MLSYLKIILKIVIFLFINANLIVIVHLVKGSLN